MVVDCHVHLALEKNDLKRCDQEAEKLLERMKRAGIDKACLIPMVFSNGDGGYFPDRDGMLFAARYLADLVKSRADTFFSFLWVNGNLDTRFLMEFTRKYVMDGVINGIKLCTEVNAADSRLEAFARFLERNGIPVLFHSWYNSDGRTFGESLPSDIAALAGKHPELRIIMAHMTGCRYRGVQDIKKYANVRMDTSGSASEDGYLDYALRELGPDRILYGSDYPGRDFAVQLSRIASVELTPEVKNKLLYKNVINFLGGRGNGSNE